VSKTRSRWGVVFEEKGVTLFSVVENKNEECTIRFRSVEVQWDA